MGQKILLINPKAPPSKRRKTSTKQRKTSTKQGKVKMASARKRRRTPAQIAATRKLVALNRRRKTTRVKRRRNPVASSPGSASAYQAVATMSNPIRRRRRRAAPKRAASRGRVYRRRNPINTTLNVLQQSLHGAAWGAAGAVGVDAIAAALPLPDNLKTGYLKFLTKGVLSGLVGTAAGYVVNRNSAASMAAGGLTVALHGALSQFVSENVPSLNLGYYSASLPADKTHALGYYTDAVPAAVSPGQNVVGMGAYVNGRNSHGRYNGKR